MNAPSSLKQLEEPGSPDSVLKDRDCSLASVQKWFGTQITQQPDSSFRIHVEDAPSFISPSTTLQPSQRVEIYHQQYWWRLIRALGKNFPFLTHLFGLSSFESEIAVPYLVAHPPHHWALALLGDTLPEWLQRAYHAEDRELVIAAAEIDRAAQKAFSIQSQLPVDFSSLTPDEILTKTLTLQPYVHLFEHKSDLFSFRDALQEKEVSHWDTHPFPELKRGATYAALFRNLKNQIVWKPLSLPEFRLLTLFQQGSTIAEACEKIEQDDYNEVEGGLALWFREWTLLQWLC